MKKNTFPPLQFMVLSATRGLADGDGDVDCDGEDDGYGDENGDGYGDENGDGDSDGDCRGRDKLEMTVIF